MKNFRGLQYIRARKHRQHSGSDDGSVGSAHRTVTLRWSRNSTCASPRPGWVLVRLGLEKLDERSMVTKEQALVLGTSISLNFTAFYFCSFWTQLRINYLSTESNSDILHHGPQQRREKGLLYHIGSDLHHCCDCPCGNLQENFKYV